MRKASTNQRKETVALGGLLASVGGIIFAVASMESAPITIGKVALAIACLVGMYLFSLPLQTKQARKKETTITDITASDRAA